MCNCEPIFLSSIKEGAIFRGDVAYGDSDKSMFFGNAVNRAYKLESEIAIHRRIVVEEDIAKLILKNIENVKCKTEANNSEYVAFLGAIRMPKMPSIGEEIIE